MKRITPPEKEPCILIEGPQWGNADFYGRWLLAAANAEVLWQQALKDDHIFSVQVDSVTIAYIPNFGIGATVLLSMFVETHSSVIVRMDEDHIELVDELTMMVQMGFFDLTGERYQLVIPERLSPEVIKEAVRKLARTEDEEFCLHPEHLLTTMPFAEACVWLKRLRAMDENKRCADRMLLLGA